jgi:hypothetical protein
MPVPALVLLMQFCEPLTATVIFPFIFRLVNDTGVTEGNEDKTGYYAGIIVRPLFLRLGSTALQSCPGIDILSCRDVLRPTMGETFGQDRPQASRVDRAPGHDAFDAPFWFVPVFLRTCHQPVPRRSSKRQHRRLEIHHG